MMKQLTPVTVIFTLGTIRAFAAFISVPSRKACSDFQNARRGCKARA